jgi:NO-binding membrane sensor protein with MHYT domain
MIAVSLGLYILFVVFRPKLQHSWYKRLAVAMILGAGVTVMHFVALVGTHYFAREGTDLSTPADSTTKKIISTFMLLLRFDSAFFSMKLGRLTFRFSLGSLQFRLFAS